VWVSCKGGYRVVSVWRALHLLCRSRSGMVQTWRQSSRLSPNYSLNRTQTRYAGCAG
jgi:hypothetical protein